jgi:glutamate/tyrosine decarboxylase-like PLP-dependent enzyme
MADPARPEPPRNRRAPMEMDPQAFRRAGHRLVDRLAEHLAALRQRPLTPGESPAEVRTALGDRPLPAAGADPEDLLAEAADLLFAHSLYNGHPRFFGFITASAAPIGALADLLAATVNPNLGGWLLSPIATEIEAQTVRWIAELLGYPTTCGGLLTSGGNMANMVAFWAARRAKAPWDLRTAGVAAGGRRLRVYASRETHTWIEKATDLAGMGTEAIRWIATDGGLRMDLGDLRRRLAEDRDAGDLPFLVVGTAGSVSTGAVDPLPELAALCRHEGLWFHVDGAYGAPAACVAGASPEFAALGEADSLAVDPHKWLYAPLEAGCTLVRDPAVLPAAFRYHPPYYPEAEEGAGGGEPPPLMYHEHGPQNSRGFRALKVWLGLRQVGREGYARMIADDVALARRLHELAAAHPELEARTLGLSIATFRYVPPDLRGAGGTSNTGGASKAGGARGTDAAVEAYLDALNAELMKRLQAGGEAFVTHAVVGGRFLLRACIVNFRTSAEDVEALPENVVRLGREVDRERRPAGLG